METKNKYKSLYTIVIIGMLSALVFTMSSLSIPLGDVSRIHFGNIMCLISGLLFGPLIGGLSSGIGSMMFDFTNPIYVREFWITFITKFAMGFLAGWLNKTVFAKMNNKLRPAFSATLAAFAYVCLYMAKSVIQQNIEFGLTWQAMQPILITKAGASLLNGGIAVLGSVLLYAALRPALSAAGLFKDKETNAKS